MDFSKGRLKHFKWPISVRREMQVSPEQIWSTISTAGVLENCHSFCQKNPVHRWPGIGSKDEIHYYSGMILHREFVTWIDGTGYDLLIGEKNGPKSYVSWRIGEATGGAASLTITIYPHLLQNLPPAIRWLPYRLKVQPELRKYLQSVLQGIEWFIVTGEPVRKNQFGCHRWFSTRND